MNLLFSSDSLLQESGGQSQAIFDLSDELKKKIFLIRFIHLKIMV